MALQDESSPTYVDPAHVGFTPGPDPGRLGILHPTPLHTYPHPLEISGCPSHLNQGNACVSSMASAPRFPSCGQR